MNLTRPQLYWVSRAILQVPLFGGCVPRTARNLIETIATRLVRFQDQAVVTPEEMIVVMDAVHFMDHAQAVAEKAALAERVA